jgi:hypothetical protein
MHRATEIAKLANLVRAPDTGLRIAAITGPGGVGKSYLIDEVFRCADPREYDYLQLSVDASNPQTRGDFFGLIDGQLAARSLPPPARPDYDYFPQLRRIAGIYRQLIEQVSTELGASGVSEDVKKAALALLRAAQILNRAMPKTRGVLDVARVALDVCDAAAALDRAWDLLASLKALRDSSTLPGPLGDLLGTTRKLRVRHDLFNITADALTGDLAAMLDTYRKRDVLKLTHPPLRKFKRLLLVLDDFEATAPVLGEFVISALLPRLAAASHSALVLIASRDDLEAIHPGFGQHAKRWIVERVALTSFDRAAAFELMTEARVPEQRREAVFAATRGFPFLLALAIEEATAPDADSALHAKKFFERTTRWLTERERDWFISVCYLDLVNEDTLGQVLGGDGDPVEVQRWFEREASIRDPLAPVFTVRPLIREKVLRYLAIRSPSKHAALLERARKINRPAELGATATRPALR